MLRDSRWLLEIAKEGKGEKFFDCGESRDGNGYKNVTSSDDTEVKAARERFAAILAKIPAPKPHEGLEAKASKKATKAEKKPADDKIARFVSRDQNKDGLIDHSEFIKTATAKDPAANEARFKMFDSNQDGGVTKEEFLSEGKAGK